jgi:triosephosphate isomerase
MRRPLIAGNWKMNLSLPVARELLAAIVSGLEREPSAGAAVDVACCPPAVYLFPLAEAVRGSPVLLGAQDAYFESSGAFTGEIAASMLAECGARFVIVGHSERRHTIGHLEDDWMVNRKVRAVLGAGMTPILCVGETLGERDADRTFDVLTFQVTAGLIGLDLRSGRDLVIAYEPVWAIGTGRNATPQQAQEAHAHIRGRLRELYGAVADEVRIVYGGSLKPENAREIMAQPDVDGGLVGGASLRADSFLGIIRATLAAGR